MNDTKTVHDDELKIPKNKQFQPPNSVKSIPLNEGYAFQVNSNRYRGLRRNDVNPRLEQELLKQTTCDVQRMLAHFVSMVQPDALHGKQTDQSDADFLKPFLEQMTDIANKPAVLSAIQTFSQKMNEDTSTEKVMYHTFAELCNAGFRSLRSHDCNGLIRKANEDLDILFHVLDPSVENGTYTSQSNSSRRIDGAFLPLSSARRGLSKFQVRMDTSWADLVQRESVKKPAVSLPWRDLFSNNKCQHSKAKLVAVPPPKYEADTKLSTLDQSGFPAEELKQPSKAKRRKVSSNFPAGSPVLTGSAQPQDRNVQPSISLLPSPPPSPSHQISSAHGSWSIFESGKRLRNSEHADTKKLLPITQCASYAVEMLSHSPWMTHAISELVVNDCIWIWWHDRQGTIQSIGFNFVNHLPHLLLLLLCFQRFTLSDWGIKEDLIDDRIRNYYSGHPSGVEYEHLKAMYQWPTSSFLDTEKHIRISLRTPIHNRYCLIGRATEVRECTYDKSAWDEYILKLSWPEENREFEKSIIDTLSDEGASDERLRDHIPKVKAAREVNYNTGTIRHALGITHEDGTAVKGRILRYLVQKKLQPIHQLEGEVFFKAWLECVMCHYAAWRNGIQHADPSLENCMYDPTTKCGILNDWDLAVRANAPHASTGRTGTIPFMAIDLLSDEYWKGILVRQYRHDLEGFQWVLAWVCMCSESHEDQGDPRLNLWRTGDRAACRQRKVDFLLHVGAGKCHPRQTCNVEWNIAETLLLRMSIKRSRWEIEKAERRLLGHRDEDPATEDPEVEFEEFWNILLQMSSKVPYLAGLLELLAARTPTVER